MFYYRKTGFIGSNNPFVQRKVYLGNRVFMYERRGTEGMGRFGAGWNVNFGFQAGSFKNLILLRGAIFNLFICSIRVRLADKFDNEALGRIEAKAIQEREAREWAAT